MQNNDLETLAAAIEEVRCLLIDYGEAGIAERMARLMFRLAQGDPQAVSTTISEATGSMGSLNDLILYRRKGRVRQKDESANERLRELVAEIERRARRATHSLGITLVK